MDSPERESAVTVVQGLEFSPRQGGTRLSERVSRLSEAFWPERDWGRESLWWCPLMDVIPRALLGGVHGGVSFIGLNSTNLEVRVHGGAYTIGRNSTRIMWWCLTART
ncbi:hypothetical protein DEO72_LG2g3865 [Vigna unguiculata]|uniref:Uncharacterized protein n=1 Tax=Vigna unguiculata TaxID=3917 RepID=A0A4D6L4V8_VIGUN|nr:hypothetical protein DEO72_LG2g3865 [Vigna unguiculata]